MLIDALDWLGHASFRITLDRAVVYIDPYRVADDAPPADLILITHGHYDHFSPQDVERLSKRGTWLVGPAAVAERVSGQVHRIGPGETLEDELVRGVHIGAVAAYNTSKWDADGTPFHPRDAGWVGYALNDRAGGRRGGPAHPAARGGSHALGVAYRHRARRAHVRGQGTRGGTRHGEGSVSARR